MEQAREFFTVASIATLAGASGAVLVVTNTLRKLFGMNALRTCAGASLIIVGASAYAAGVLTSMLGFVLALVNACLLFCTVVGMQEFAGGATRQRVSRAAKEHGGRVEKFFGSWLHPDGGPELPPQTLTDPAGQHKKDDERDVSPRIGR